MKQIPLGTQGLVVSQQGLGCMGMSEFYGEANEAESLATFERAVELGVTFFDTADVYGPHTNEVLVGKALRPHRDNVVIATKFGAVRDADGTRRGISGKADYVRKACEASLKRLGVETIDLYYQHRPDPATPIEETIGAMAELVRAGKVRYLGLSEASPVDIRRAHAVHPISALQSEYSLWSREPEDEVLPLLDELGIGFVPYSPLSRGFLTGAITRFDDFAEDDYRRFSPRFQGENFDRNLQLVEKVKQLASDRGCTPGQFALAWVHSHASMAPIPGTKRRTYLEENVAAADIALSGEELRQVDELMPPGAAAGGRYPAGMMPQSTPAAG